MNRLPGDRQAALADFIDHHTLIEAVAYLAASEGIKTTQSSLTKFRASYQTRQDLDKDSGSLDVNIDESQQASHGLTREQLYHLGQERLMIRAIRLGSHTAWSKIHLLRQNQERICQNQQRIQESAEWRKLEERRVKLLEQKTAPPAKPEHKAGSGIDPEEHAAHVRRSLGLPEDYVFPGVRERQEKARLQQEQEKALRAAKRNKNAPSPVAPPQPAPATPPNPAPENAESSTCRPGAPTGRHEPTTATGGLPPELKTPPSLPTPAPETRSTDAAPQPVNRVGTHAIAESPLPPRCFAPTILSTKPLDEMEEINEMLDTYGTVGDKYLMLTGEGLELYSRSNAFLSRRIHPWFSLAPDIVRQAIKNLRNGLL